MTLTRFIENPLEENARRQHNAAYAAKGRCSNAQMECEQNVTHLVNLGQFSQLGELNAGRSVVETVGCIAAERQSEAKAQRPRVSWQKDYVVACSSRFWI